MCVQVQEEVSLQLFVLNSSELEPLLNFKMIINSTQDTVDCAQ